MAPAAARPLRHWRRILVLALLIPVLGFALYTWVVLHWAYSSGYRSGTLQKFSEKGWISKTYEGELWQSVVANVAPQVWGFSVRDAHVIHQLDSLVGKPVRLHYTEHRGVPPNLFGDTRYYVDSVAAVAP
jgi:hypothetical protein